MSFVRHRNRESVRVSFGAQLTADGDLGRCGAHFGAGGEEGVQFVAVDGAVADAADGDGGGGGAEVAGLWEGGAGGKHEGGGGKKGVAGADGVDIVLAK